MEEQNIEDNPKGKRIITWPAGIYHSKNGKILLVIEREWWPQWQSWKKPGQFFVPAGKKRQNETMLGALIRETWEETGIKEEYNIISENNLLFKGKVGLETNNEILLIDVFNCNKELDLNVLEKHPTFFDNEIIQRTFFDIKELLEFDVSIIRPWLYEILYILLWWKIEERTLIKNGEYRKQDRNKITDLKQNIKDLL